MGTIAQELTRIQNAKASLKTSIENKGVQVPANTLIDGYPALVDQISGGGGSELEDAFAELTNINSFCARDDNRSRLECFKVLKDYIPNVIDFSYLFSSNKRENIQYFVDELKNTDLTNINTFERIFYDILNGDTQGTITIDLRGLSVKGNCMNFMSGRSNTELTSQTIVKFDKDTFKDCTNLQSAFSYLGNGVILDYYDTDNIIDLSTAQNLTKLFAYSNMTGYRFNGTESKILNIKVENCTSVNSMFLSSNFLRYFEELNFIGDTENILDYSLMFDTVQANNSTLKKISGMNFQNVSSSSGTQIFNYGSSTSNYTFKNVGDFTVVNGSSLSENAIELDIHRIWQGSATITKNGKTLGYWFEQFANSLGAKTASGTQTIYVYNTLYNSLSETQKALITDKGYLLAGRSN